MKQVILNERKYIYQLVDNNVLFDVGDGVELPLIGFNFLGNSLL